MPTMQNMQRPVSNPNLSAPVTPGPRPAAGLPSRQTLKNDLPALPQRQDVAPVDDGERIVPGNFADEPSIWVEKLKTVGLALGALAAAVLAWFLAANFF
jgi:hypothetical protein